MSVSDDEDRRRAAEYLHGLQAEMYEATGSDVGDGRESWERLSRKIAAQMMPESLNGEADDVVKQSMSQLEQALRERPTPLESPELYLLMKSLADGIESTGRERGFHLPPRPLFGTLPLRQFNAMAIQVPGVRTRLVAFQHGVFGFVNLICKAVAACFPTEDGNEKGLVFSTDFEQISAGLQADPTPIARMADFLWAYVYDGDPHRAKPYVAHAPAMHLAQILRQTGETFVMAHEYGHLAAGHLDRGKDRRSVCADGDTESDVISMNWDQEFSADAIGLVLTLTTIDHVHQVNPSLSFAGIDLIFSSMQLVDRALSVAMHGDVVDRPATASHPPSLDRQTVIRELLPQLVGDELTPDAISLADVTVKIMESMWESIEPRFKADHAAGRRPHPIWIGG